MTDGLIVPRCTSLPRPRPNVVPRLDGSGDMKWWEWRDHGFSRDPPPSLLRWSLTKKNLNLNLNPCGDLKNIWGEVEWEVRARAWPCLALRCARPWV